MKTSFEDVTETQKRITIEIPSDVVSQEIDRVTKGYSKQARLPGFRPGKVPASVIKQRFKVQILHDVLHGQPARVVLQLADAEELRPERLVILSMVISVRVRERPAEKAVYVPE